MASARADKKSIPVPLQGLLQPLLSSSSAALRPPLALLVLLVLLQDSLELLILNHPLEQDSPHAFIEVVLGSLVTMVSEVRVPFVERPSLSAFDFLEDLFSPLHL